MMPADINATMNQNILFPSAMMALAALAIVLISEFTTAQEATPAAAAQGPDIVALAAADPNLTTLVSALRAAELVETLQGRGPFTVFAPNNAAFAKLPAGTLDSLMMPENKKKLAAILKHHVIRGNFPSGEMESGRQRTLDGDKVEITKENAGVRFGAATVLVADREAANGTLHVIDAVVMPD